MSSKRGNGTRNTSNGYGGYGDAPREAPAAGYGYGHGHGHGHVHAPSVTAAPGYGYNKAPTETAPYVGYAEVVYDKAPTETTGPAYSYGGTSTETSSYGYGRSRGNDNGASTETAAQGYDRVKPVKLSFHEMLSYGHKPWDADYREEKKALEKAFTKAERQAYADAQKGAPSWQ